jgi:hypothetical protein
MPAGINIATRAPLALAFFVVGARAASAADLDLSPDLAATVEAKLDALATAEIPNDRLLQKLREGRAKKIPDARIVPALVRLADSLLWASGRLEDCAGGDSPRRTRLVELAADLLFDSVPRDGLAPTLAHLCARPDAVAELTTASELYSFLIHKLAASPKVAWSLAAELLRRGEEQGAVNRLIPDLRDIYRSKRSIDRPLAIAVERLRAGASLRTVRHELRNQFLRR